MSRRVRDSEGFTLIEVMVAALIMVLAFTALSVIFISGQSQASADVQQTQLINIADQEMEQIRAGVKSVGFSALGMTSPAPTQISPRVTRNTFFDPDSFVVPGTGASCFLISTNYDSVTPSATTSSPKYGVTTPSQFSPWSTCGTTSGAEPIQTLAKGSSTSSPAPLITWSSTSVSQCASGAGGAISVPCWTPLTANCTVTGTTIATLPSCAATVYAFVTDTFVGCGTSGGNGCPATSGGVVQCASANLATTTSTSSGCSDARRVVIAVVPNPAVQGSPNATQQLQRVTPVYLTSVFTNPNPSGSSSNSAGLALNLSVL